MSAGSMVRASLSRRTLVIWLAAAALFIAGVLATFAVLNATLYTAGSFVSRYLNAIADDDIAAVLSTPGVREDVPDGVSRALLRPGVIATGPSEIEVVAEEARSDGSRLVTVDYRLGTESFSSRYEVKPLPAVLGIVARWEFASSPLTVISISVANGSEFTAGGLTLDARTQAAPDRVDDFSQSAEYLSVAPARLDLEYRSELLEAEPVTLNVTPGGDNSAGVVVLPTPALVERVQVELDDFLAECATQRVLQPAGCPFGAIVNDRVTSEPRWSLVSNPVVTLAPGAAAFEMPPTPGVAHLTVNVQNLRDGAPSTIDRDEEYAVALRVRVLDDKSIAIELD